MSKPILILGALGTLLVSVAAASGPAAVDTAVEGAVAEEARVLVKEVVVRASLEAVWAAWTTEEGLAPVSPDSRIELEPGGDYAWFLQLEPDAKGRRGSEGSRVVAFVPRESITFDWTFSPATPRLRAEGATTRVVVSFEPLGEEGVRVRLVAGGWQEGEEWELGYRYFERAWEWVLQEMKRHLEAANAEAESGGAADVG